MTHGTLFAALPGTAQMSDSILGYLEHYRQTLVHKAWVFYYMWKLFPAISNHISWKPWLWRSIRHDWSKFTPTEASGFAKIIFRLKYTEYGSSEYKENLKTIRSSLRHHYAVNDHHHQYWVNLFFGEGNPLYDTNRYALMPLIARREMICDWAAAVRRSANGDLYESIEINQKRMRYTDKQADQLRGYARRLIGERDV